MPKTIEISRELVQPDNGKKSMLYIQAEVTIGADGNSPTGRDDEWHSFEASIDGINVDFSMSGRVYEYCGEERTLSQWINKFVEDALDA